MTKGKTIQLCNILPNMKLINGVNLLENIIDAHIHLDQYKAEQIEEIIADLDVIHCTNLISVSTDLDSCRANLALAQQYKQVMPAFGFHPEQPLPSDLEINTLFSWIEENIREMTAVGEIGLPYYLRMQSENEPYFPFQGYIELLEQFLISAKKWDKPVILHAVYEDASIVCDLLEKHSIGSAHFHWFKGDNVTTQRMIDNGYYISVTPDVLYEQEIQDLVKQYPHEQIMAETDGPWPFKKKFEGQMTHPNMIHSSISIISELKGTNLSDTYRTLHTNTKSFYGID